MGEKGKKCFDKNDGIVFLIVVVFLLMVFIQKKFLEKKTHWKQ